MHVLLRAGCRRVIGCCCQATKMTSHVTSASATAVSVGWRHPVLLNDPTTTLWAQVRIMSATC